MSDRGYKQLSAGQRAEIGGRLRELLAGANIPDLARRAEITERSLRRYKTDGIPELAGLISLADACGVSLDWLINGRGDKNAGWITSRLPGMEPPGPGEAIAVGPYIPIPELADKRTYVSIPRFNIQASAGGGSLVEHAQVVEYLAFDIDFVRNRLRRDPKYLVLIEARGDSMEPTIRDGDILTVDITPDQPLRSSTLYVLRVATDLIVKRLERRLDGALVVHSDNPRYSSQTVATNQLDQLQILGQVLLVSAPPR